MHPFKNLNMFKTVVKGLKQDVPQDVTLRLANWQQEELRRGNVKPCFASVWRTGSEDGTQALKEDMSLKQHRF